MTRSSHQLQPVKLIILSAELPAVIPTGFRFLMGATLLKIVMVVLADPVMFPYMD